MRKLLWIVVVSLCAAVPFYTHSESESPVQIPMLKDLHADARAAQAAGLPILVMFSASSCSYCRLVEEEFLKPMILSGEYTDKVVIRMVLIDGYPRIKGFQGRSMDPAEFADEQNVSLTPTLKFYDHTGKELVPQMVGINTVEMYGGYLDAAIDAARAKVRAQSDAGYLARR